jgi:hypothetical protein
MIAFFDEFFRAFSAEAPVHLQLGRAAIAEQ